LSPPHTGSFVADLTVELDGGKCNFSNRVEQAICDTMSVAIHVVVADLGPLATRELTGDFLATWNPQQTIGRCPVSGIAGDHVGFDLPLLDYYTPSDGLVGEASALAEAATDINGDPIPAPEIPDFREAGIYDVVHGTAVSVLSKKNLLNTPAISAKVVETITSGAEDCNASARSVVAAATSPPANPTRLRVPLYRLISADNHGRLPIPGKEDFAVSNKHVALSCGRTPLEAIPISGDPRLRLHPTGSCERRLEARNMKGDAVANALTLRAHPDRDAVIRVEGETARIRIRGKQPRRLVAEARVDGRWTTLDLDRRGHTMLPDSGSELALRVRALRGKGEVPDTGHVSLAR
jgi:hypothetical protein